VGSSPSFGTNKNKGLRHHDVTLSLCIVSFCATFVPIDEESLMAMSAGSLITCFGQTEWASTLLRLRFDIEKDPGDTATIDRKQTQCS
jgi:hypothetical protein